jgi:hypothetical protein
MGFEENFEKGWRDKHWGRAFRHFAKGGSPEEVSRDIKTAVCGILREMEPSGEQKSLLGLIDIFTDHRHLAMFQQPLFWEEADCPEVLNRFQDACTPILRSEENSTTIQALYGVAREHLEDTLLGASQAADNASARKALFTGFLRRLIAARMNASAVVAGQKERVGPEVTEARLCKAISQVPLDQIATQFLAGKGKKIRAPRSNCRTDEQFARMSLLKTRKR